MMTTAQVAGVVGVSSRTIRRWRTIAGQGPAFVRLGPRRYRYDRAEVDAWLAGCWREPAAAIEARDPVGVARRLAAAWARVSATCTADPSTW